jgi:hypothetical protein
VSRSRRNSALIIVAALTLAVAAWGVASDARSVARFEGVPVEVVEPTPAPRRQTRTARGPRPDAAIVSAAPVLFTRSTASGRGSDGVSPSAPVTRMTPTVHRRTAPTRVGATPRSVQVLRVAVPTALPGRRDVQWTMQPSRRAEVLSAYAGAVPAAAEDSARAVTVVTRVPASAAAGILPVGEIAFTVDSVQVVVPVELVVERIRRASVIPGRPAFSALAGQTLLLTAEVRNLGNSVDTLTVTTEVPADWRTVADRRVVLIPGERQTLRLETRLPRGTGNSAMYPAVRVLIGDSVASVTTLNVTVTDPSTREAPVGPTLTVATSGAVGDTIASSAAFDFFLSGSISNRIQVLGRAGFAADDETADRRALGRVGTYLGGSFLSVRGPGWYVTGGNTGATVSTLAGIGAFGKGVSAGVTHNRVTVNGLVVNTVQGGGVQAGGKADYLMRRGSVGLTASHLEDGGSTGRGLDAVGVAGAYNAGAGFRITSEVAHRSFEGGSGVGVAVGLDRTTRTQFLAVSAQHAPGGSQAFGRALTDMSAAAGQRLGEKASMQVNWFSSLDRPPVAGGEFTSTGWSATPRYELNENLRAEVEVRRNRYETESATSGGFSSTDLTASAALRKTGGRFGWSLGGGTTTSERVTIFGSGTRVTISADRFNLNAGGSAVLPRAIVGTGIEYSQSGSGVGVAPKQARMTFLASRIAPFNSAHAPLFRAEGEFTTYFGAQPSVFIARIGTEISLPSDLTLTVDAERNPLLRANGAAVPWIVAFRLERGFGLPWAARGTMTRGAVYQDRNANGVRDSDEPGMAGVLVRRGSQSATTDANGRFALQGKDRIPTEIDPASLPEGVVPPVFRGAPEEGTLVLGVVPTGALTVQLLPVPDDLGRLPESNRNQLAVLARDSHGAEWYLRADSTGVVRFDALPPGTYAFLADFAGTTERLRQMGDPTTLEIKPGENVPPLVIRYALRAARLFNGGSGATDQGRRRR